MPLQIRRGTEAERTAMTTALFSGEPIFTTDTKKLYIGDGTTLGGVDISSNAGLPGQGGNNGKFLTTNGTNLSWATVPPSGIANVQADSTPSLGGNLTLNGNNIIGTGNLNITGSININATATGRITISTNNDGEYFGAVGVTGGIYAPGTSTKISRGTVGSPTTVFAGDVISNDIFLGYSGTNYVLSTVISHAVDPNATISANNVPGTIVIASVSNNDPINAKGILIDYLGHVTIAHNLAQVAQATLDVNGTAKLAVLSSAPASPVNGMIAIADGSGWNPAGTGKSVMVVYLGGGWRVSATAP